MGGWAYNPMYLYLFEPLISDLDFAGQNTVSLVTIEVGCLGHFLLSTVYNICKVCHIQKKCPHY